MRHDRLDSLWGLTFGDGATAGPRATLFYTASIAARAAQTVGVGSGGAQALSARYKADIELALASRQPKGLDPGGEALGVVAYPHTVR
jgi:hypothetical protein